MKQNDSMRIAHLSIPFQAGYAFVLSFSATDTTFHQPRIFCGLRKITTRKERSTEARAAPVLPPETAWQILPSPAARRPPQVERVQ